MSNLFKGTATALATPFKNGRIDFKTFENMIEFQISSGINALLFCGTTGESSTMTMEEQLSTIEFGIKKVNKRVPVIANTGSNNTQHSIELSKKVESMGADALLSVAPYYNKTSQRGLIAHYTAIAKSVKTPIILYNVPTRTVVNIDTDTIIELSKIPNIIGVKECRISQITDVINATDDDFSIWSGCDDMVLEFMTLGSKGLISVMSNAIPQKTVSITEKCLEGNINVARAEFYKILPFVNALSQDVNPIPIKKALDLMGIYTGELRLPLVKMEENATKTLKSAMKALNLI